MLQTKIKHRFQLQSRNNFDRKTTKNAHLLKQEYYGKNITHSYVTEIS